jgi:hypothetical protein
MTGPKVLVACSDSELRMSCFNRVSALGVRVDAVGDQKGLGRRTEKDKYQMILHDSGIEVEETSADHVLLVESNSELEKDLENQVRTLLDVPVRNIEEEEKIDEPPPPWLKNNRGW